MNLALYVRPAGSTVIFRLHSPKNLLTYVLHVVKYTAGGKIRRTVLPPELSDGDGAVVEIDQDAQGYKLILQAWVGSTDGTAEITVSFTGEPEEDDWEGKVAFPKAESPVAVREWNVLVGDPS